MPLSPPTVASDPASQAHANAALATVTGFVDDANTAVAAAQADATQGVADAATAQTTADDAKVAIRACFAALKQFILVTNSYKPNAEPIPAELAKAFSDVDAALAP